MQATLSDFSNICLDVARIVPLVAPERGCALATLRQLSDVARDCGSLGKAESAWLYGDETDEKC